MPQLRPLLSHLPFLAVLLVGCATEPDDPRSIAGNKYDNPTIGLTLQFPAAWEVDLDRRANTYKVDVAALGPASEQFRPNVTVIHTPHSGTTDWTQILPAARQELERGVPGFGNYRDSVYTVDGRSVAELNYTATTQGFDLRLKQVLIYNKNRDITVSYTDLAHRFDANAEFQAIQASMTLR